MVYDKRKEESFIEWKNTLNDVNENYKDVFKALIVKSADYKENEKKNRYRNGRIQQKI